MRNLTGLYASEIWDNSEISQVVFMPQLSLHAGLSYLLPCPSLEFINKEDVVHVVYTDALLQIPWLFESFM